LGEIFEFADEYSIAHGIAQPVLFSLKFVIEELFTNMVKYSVSDTGSDIAIDLEKDDHRVTVRLTDSGVDPFDVTRAGDADVSLSLEDRTVGGLGLHLVKRMVDSMEYAYSGRQSIITFSKKLE
jgi:anti-sigma regulatory factor (Ser/Thr protein kinase)